MGSETVKGRVRGLRQSECFLGEERKRQVKPLIFQHRKRKRWKYEEKERKMFKLFQVKREYPYCQKS